VLSPSERAVAIFGDTVEAAAAVAPSGLADVVSIDEQAVFKARDYKDR